MKVEVLLLGFLAFFALSLYSKDSLLWFYANQPGSPIVHDDELNEFQITYTSEVAGKKVKTSIPINYCPVSGLKQSSGRDQQLGKVDDSERIDVIDAIQNLNTIEEIVSVVGKEPDHKYRISEGRTQHNFIFEEFLLFVLEERGEVVRMSLGPVWRDKRDND